MNIPRAFVSDRWIHCLSCGNSPLVMVGNVMTTTKVSAKPKASWRVKSNPVPRLSAKPSRSDAYQSGTLLRPARFRSAGGTRSGAAHAT